MQAEQSWTGRYVLNFEQLLAESGQKIETGALREPLKDNILKLSAADDAAHEDQEEIDPDQPVFSLVTGKYRHAKRYGGQCRSFHRGYIIFTRKQEILHLKDHRKVLLLLSYEIKIRRWLS